MDGNGLSQNIRAALSYENEYNKALSAYRNAVTTVNMRKNALNITFGDRIKTMIPEAAITAIFWIGTSIKPGGTIWFIMSCSGMCVVAYAAYVFLAKSKKRYMNSEEYKKKKGIKRVFIAEAIVLAGSLMSLPNMLKTVMETSDDLSYSTNICTFIASYGIIVIMAIILPLLAKKKAKQFEAELDEQTTDEEKLLYK